MADNEVDWGRLRRTARSMDAEANDLISEYASLVEPEAEGDEADAGAAQPASRAEALEATVGALLRRMDEVAHKMQEEVQAGRAGRPADRADASRAREVYWEMQRRFAALQRQRRGRLERASLLEGGAGATAQAASGDVAALRERAALLQNHSAVDDLLAQASSTQSSLVHQRGSLQTSSGVLTQIGGALPNVGRLIRGIQARRNRDSLIIGLVIALCVCFLIWYKFG